MAKRKDIILNKDTVKSMGYFGIVRDYTIDRMSGGPQILLGADLIEIIIANELKADREYVHDQLRKIILSLKRGPKANDKECWDKLVKFTNSLKS